MPQDTHVLLRAPPPRRNEVHPSMLGGQPTPPLAWAVAAVCVLLWLAVALGGGAVLAVYLVFRPKVPRLEISSASLNGAYLDTGTLLNADLTLLANFTNPNRKVDVSFGYMSMDVYYGSSMIATGALEPFSETRGETVIRRVHMVSSEVELGVEAAEVLREQVERNRVQFRVEGTFRTTSDFGSFLQFSYWLHSRCDIILSGPPSGVLLSSSCRTKR